MAYKITLNDPSQPKGDEFDFGGILLENGKSLTLKEEDEARFVSRHGMSVKEKLGNSTVLEISGTSELKGGDS